MGCIKNVPLHQFFVRLALLLLAFFSAQLLHIVSANHANDDDYIQWFIGDGGLPITHYVIEWDTKSDFSSPANSVSVPANSTSYRIGGRDTITGAESDELEPGGTYYVRITPFNSLGPGPSTTLTEILHDTHSAADPSSPVGIGPLVDTVPDAPTIRTQGTTNILSATSLLVQWDTPILDGGSRIQRYNIEYDSNENFTNSQTLQVSVVSEVQTIVVESPNVTSEVQTIRATAEVTNEVQSVRTTITGVDEIQTITTTADDVVAEVQTITTNAIDVNEEQSIQFYAPDIDEIQLVRIHGDDIPEIQKVTVSVERTNEVQQLGIVISNINTDGDGINSFACAGVSVGEPCQDIEDAISGSFTASFDFDQCGGGTGIANYCQEALTKYDPGLGDISCTPGLVNNALLGGDHCVSDPIIQSFSANEGDAGTLQKVLNDMVDDNGVSFMTTGNIPGKATAVTVTRTSGIKNKGSCTIDPLGVDPATCSGEYEISYSIEFDAYHTSGDVPPVTIVHSDVRVDTSSSSYLTTMCPAAYYTEGCEGPHGSALDSDHGSFYENAESHTAVESVKGSQPTGMIALDYECESSVTVLPMGKKMTTSSSGLIGVFDDASFVIGILEGHWVRFSAGDGIDVYRRVVSVDSVTGAVTFSTEAPTDTDYSDVEYGYYFSEWDTTEDYPSGVSDRCLSSRIHSTLPIDVTTEHNSASVVDWSGKIGALSVIDASGIIVARNLVPDMSANVGFEWMITFQKQPGSVNQMKCSTVTGNSDCIVTTMQESSILDGTFTLGTFWPHEYIVITPSFFESSGIRWNSEALTLKIVLESILDGDDKVFGNVNVARIAYVPLTHHRWSGGYLWTITFTSRGGNIPALTPNAALLGGINVVFGVADENSGLSDTYQGVPNSSTLGADDPGTARDGNQISGSVAISWAGNSHHEAVISPNVFSVGTGGSNSDRFTALSANAMKDLLTAHIFGSEPNQITVTRSANPSQSMGYTYYLIFSHENVGGDLAPLVVVDGTSLLGKDAAVRIDEAVKGASITGTFQIRFNGETTRPINHDATGADLQDALNQLSSIAPSAVTVTRTTNPIRTGPSDGSGGMSTQVGGYVWYVTFASNVWKDPTETHDLSDIPGNWHGPGVSYSDVWDSGHSKAWGKNVGNVPMMTCIDAGLSTTNGELPANGCTVAELVTGTEPLGGQFKLCLDSITGSNGVMSVESDSCTEYIDHNAPASTVESNGDGSSMEEKLESLENIGDVAVTRSIVNTKNGGYTWTIEFLRDIDGPCQQIDDMSSLCNAPGNVPKICDPAGSTECDTTALLGTCSRPGSCTKLTVLDASDFANNIRPPGNNERQIVVVKDPKYLGWEDGTVVDQHAVIKEYTLSIDGVQTTCIKHMATAGEMQAKIQNLLDGGDGGTVKVDRVASESDSPNGFLYYVDFYDTGDLPLMVPLFSSDAGVCSNPFENSQEIIVSGVSDGAQHVTTCDQCVDGVIQRGDFSTFEVGGDSLSDSLPWNADPSSIKLHLETITDRFVDVERTVMDKYGTIEWTITFTGNPGMTPPGTGDVDPLDVAQLPDSSGNVNPVIVSEIKKGSTGLAGSFVLDYLSASGRREVFFNEPAPRLKRKLGEINSIGKVYVTRDCYPSCHSGGWGAVAVAPGTSGGYQWSVYFLKNPGISDGFTFPPGSGAIDPPTIDSTDLQGDGADAECDVAIEGSLPLTGSFRLNIGDKVTEPIPYNADPPTIEKSLHDLSNTGLVTVRTGNRATREIPDITVDVKKDGTIADVSGGDLRKYLAPGDKFRVGGKQYGTEVGELYGADGAERIGAVTVKRGSPILSDVDIGNRHIHLGESVRIGGETFSIAKNGVEVQQVAVHRVSTQGDAEFYQLKASVDGIVETTSCLRFDASASDMEIALNNLAVVGVDGVLVTKSERTSGYTGNAHIYKIYFVGSSVLGDVDQLVAENCITGMPIGIDSTNSGVNVRTLVQGGNIEHQRVSLSSDSGITSFVPAFQLTVSDLASNSITTPCIEWGADKLGISSIVADSFLTAALNVGDNAVTDLSSDFYDVEASDFVEGIISVGDEVNPGGNCPGTVVSLGDDGKSVRLKASNGCYASTGDPFSVLQDSTVLESFSGRQTSVSEITKITVYSDAEVEASYGLYKITLNLDGTSRSTNCIKYDAPANIIQNEIDGLFDFDRSGIIDADDKGHVVVSREGDGSASWAYGYVYSFESKGSSSSIGASAVLGSSAPLFEITQIGTEGGCADAGGDGLVVAHDATVTNESKIVTTATSVAGTINSGTRVRISASGSPTKTYFVESLSQDGQTITLSSEFVGLTTSNSATITMVTGGVPVVEVDLYRKGVDEYVYDVFFVGSYWQNVPRMAINVFGDGVCTSDAAHVTGGMNRDMSVSTVVDGGEMLSENAYALEKIVGENIDGEESLFLVPPIFTVHEETSELQRIIVKDIDNTEIWGPAYPSFKLVFNGESTGCLDVDSTESQIEDALNNLSLLCPNKDLCITVTRSVDPVLAPNGYIFNLYFEGFSVANMDIIDPSINGLSADATSSDCSPFSSVDGEVIEIETVVQGRTSVPFTSSKLPLGTADSSSLVGKWLGADTNNLPIYKVSGTFWAVRFDDYLGNTNAMSFESGTLPSSSEVTIFDNLVQGQNPNSAIISGLLTGVPYYTRVSATSAIGTSNTSKTSVAIPSKVPGSIENLSIGHALHVNEVQSISIVATHVSEVQTVTTSAAAISEIQEIVLESSFGNKIESGNFALRFPETQIVSWSSGSPVTAGSFFLKLFVPDISASIDANAGVIVTKEMKTACIPFDATAEQVKRAIELEALENGLGPDAIEVIRSGDRSFSSGYGYSYSIRFVGDSVRGNVNQMTSDFSLSGLDALGTNNCESFVSPTNDALLSISTINESDALGTDTSRAEVLVSADAPIVKGEFELSIDYYGGARNTGCIAWNSDAFTLESKLESLDNVDSVRVERFGDGTLSTVGGASQEVSDLSFIPNGPGNEFTTSPSTDLANILFVQDRIQFSGQTDTAKFYTISSVVGDTLTISEPLPNAQGVYTVTRYFGFRFVVHFDGAGMHTDKTEGSGFRPATGSNFALVSSGSCVPLKTYYNGVLSEFDDIPGTQGSVYIATRHNGLHTLSAVPTGTSSKDIQKALVTSIPSNFANPAMVTRSLEDLENGVTYTIKYGENDGNIPGLICNTDSYLVDKLISCSADTVMDGNVITGYFFLGASDAIPYDATAEEMEVAIEKMSNIGDIQVSRTSGDGQNGFIWSLTFLTDFGDVDELIPSNSLVGKDASVSVAELRKGNELGGSFSLSYRMDSTPDIAFDASASSIEAALESISAVGDVKVTTSGVTDSEGGRTFLVTFLDASTGDAEILRPNISGLSGVGKAVTIREEVKGSLAVGDSMHVSYGMPIGCSISQVSQDSCGDPIQMISFDVDSNTDFDGDPIHLNLEPDYSIQVVRVWSETFASRKYKKPGISGYFRLSSGESTTDPIVMSATANDVRFALESLPSIHTVKVTKARSANPVQGCIDVTPGSSLVSCSSSCTCDFNGIAGLQGNDLIRLGDEWFRVSSSSIISETQFELGRVDDSLVKDTFVGKSELSEAELFVWSGGYEWRITFHSVTAQVQPLRSPRHNLLPSDSVVEISVENCNKCLYVQGLTAFKMHYLRARSRNTHGYSAYTDIVSGSPKSIPSAPTNVQVEIVSGSCLEISYSPPSIPSDTTDIHSYSIQWDYQDDFSLANDSSASCSSTRFGNCNLSQPSDPYPRLFEFCGLVPNEIYYVRVAARNGVEVQEISPSGFPPDNTNWSSVLTARPVDQKPDAPTLIKAYALIRNGIQILFVAPVRDGGQPIDEYLFSWSTCNDFSTSNSISVTASSIDALYPSDTLVYNLVPDHPSIIPGTPYFVRVQAVNSVGSSEAAETNAIIPSGPPDAPTVGSLTTLRSDAFPITEATVEWKHPAGVDIDGGDSIDGYQVEWWSARKDPEIQILKLQYSSPLSDTTFSLSISPSPQLKKQTALLPWDAPADLLRREIINLGWDENNDENIVQDVEVSRSNLSNGFAWTITFGNNPDRETNDGDQILLVGNVVENGDTGSPTLSISTVQDGQRSLGMDEVQFLQIFGTGTLSGYYRLKFESSDYTSYIAIHATADQVERALEQLTTIHDVSVHQNDSVNQAAAGTSGALVHHYEITFSSKNGNVGEIVVDKSSITSTNEDADIIVHDGDNSMSALNVKSTSAIPGEQPKDYGSKVILDNSAQSYKITGLVTGLEYFVAVSARNKKHGYGTRMLPSPQSVTPTLQVPGKPANVSLGVNAGYSDSVIINFEPPKSDGGDVILRYRVELDPTASFDSPIVEDFECPSNNLRTIWKIETKVDGGGKVDGGSFTLRLEVNGFAFTTSEISYDAVALSWNETAQMDDLPIQFSAVDGGSSISAVPATDIENVLFAGDRVRFSGQLAPYKNYEIISVSGNSAILNEPFEGTDGIQSKTTRQYGGRGTPSSSRIHCQFDEYLCNSDIEVKSGSVQNKLQDLEHAITAGVLVDRDGPSPSNEFIWRVTFLDDAPDAGSDFKLSVASNSLTTAGGLGSGSVVTTLLVDGEAYKSCSGPLVAPSYGGLVKGLEYYARVFAVNSLGYSVPGQARNFQAPMVVPSAPTGVTLDVVSATEMMVLFGAPSDNGGSSVTSYLIEWSTSSLFLDVQSSTLDYLAGGAPFFKTIGGLSTGVDYYFRVSAINSQGTGPSQATTPPFLNPHQAPAPPANVEAAETSESMITVGWDEPLDDGGDEITNYRVEWDTSAGFSSSSIPPHKGYIDIDASIHRSYTIELLTRERVYYTRVFAINDAGAGAPQNTSPKSVTPRKQVPGTPHSLVATPGSVPGTVDVWWQRPRVPHHGIPCSGTYESPQDCPTKYGGTLPVSDGGEPIIEYEVEFNERPDFNGSDGGRKQVTGTSCTLLNLTKGRTYYIRVLARNVIGSGRFCERKGDNHCDGDLVSVISTL